jgi:gliding motility-associated protein GldC
MDEIVKKSKIDISIGFDKEKLPVDIRWQSSDQAEMQPVSCKGMLLAFFERESLDTLKIDLWTKDMQVVEMDRFFFQTLRAMADTYQRATQNNQLANDMQKFVNYFGEKTEIIKPE